MARKTTYTPIRVETKAASAPSPKPATSGSVRANVESGICAPSTDMPNRNAVSCTGHWAGCAIRRTSTSGSAWAFS